jgi:hypothetical protein
VICRPIRGVRFSFAGNLLVLLINATSGWGMQT